MSIAPAIAHEIESRQESVRHFVDREDLGALLIYSPPMANMWGQTGHVGYLSGWASHDRIVDSALVLTRKGPPALLVAGLPFMLEQIREVSPIEDLRLVQAVDPNAVAISRGAAASGPRDFASETLAILEENGLGGKEVGVVGIDNMPQPFYQGLSIILGERMRRVDDVVSRVRAVKSSAEIENMRKAASLSDLGFERMLEVARPGMRGIEILAEMERAVRREGADHAKYWMASGPPTSWDDSRLDIKPHERMLGEGDLMASCSYVVYRGYWCHGQRTGTLGKPSHSLESLCERARQAQDAGLANLKSGVAIREVARAVRERGVELGLELQGGRIGHGIGMDYSEQPVPLSEANQQPLKSGMTAVIHAAFSLPDSGKLFVPLGDVCHVTDEGPELLMDFPRTSFLAGT